MAASMRWAWGSPGVGLAHEPLPDAPLPINQVEGGPDAITQGFPIAKVVVDHHGVTQTELADFGRHRRRVPLPVELWAMHPDHDQPLWPEAGLDRLEPWEGAVAVPALKGPDIDQHHLATQPREAQRRTIDPGGGRGLGKLWRVPGLGGKPGRGKGPGEQADGKAAKGTVSGYLDGSDDLVRLERRTLDHRSRTPLPVYGADGLQVAALGVTHGSVPALAYRVEYGGRSLVFSGDQNGDDAQFVDFARGADLLVMAHAVPEDTGLVAARLHALPSEIGTIAQGAGVKHLLLSHLMRRSEQTLDQSLGIIRSHYPGPITIAEALLCLEP